MLKEKQRRSLMNLEGYSSLSPGAEEVGGQFRNAVEKETSSYQEVLAYNYVLIKTVNDWEIQNNALSKSHEKQMANRDTGLFDTVFPTR
jgi:hypothetical protein